MTQASKADRARGFTLGGHRLSGLCHAGGMMAKGERIRLHLGKRYASGAGGRVALGSEGRRAMGGAGHWP